MKRSTIIGSVLLIAAMTASVFSQRRVIKGHQIAGAAITGPDLQVQPGHPLMVEDFNYPTGALTTLGTNVSNGRWFNIGGTTQPIAVTAGSLTYTGYASSGVGNKIDIVSTGASTAESAARNFPPQLSGTTYAAFMVNVANTTGLGPNAGNGDHFAGFLNSTSLTSFAARVTIRLGSAANTFQVGLQAAAGNTPVFGGNLPVGTPVLVVISYQIVSGAANDVTNMWINPTITGSQPAATLTQTSVADIADVSRFYVRQGTTTTPNASIDGIRIATTWTGLNAAYFSPAVVDFDGDGRTDFSIYRSSGVPNTSPATWWNMSSGNGAVTVRDFGIAADFYEPADYDGDGKSDIAVWRPPINADLAMWFVLRSSDGTVTMTQFGSNGDDPGVVGDYDGDGKADLAIYRVDATPGQSTWWFRPSGGPLAGINVPLKFGKTIDHPSFGLVFDSPLPGDFNGDGLADAAVVRPTDAGGALVWIHQGDGTGNDATPTSVIQWGHVPSDPNDPAFDSYVPGDYDGDGKTDLAIVRSVSAQWQWWMKWSSDGSVHVVNWGKNTDDIVQGDYDGDGKTDIATYRSSDATYYVIASQSNTPLYQTWGTANSVFDSPANDYNFHVPY